MIGKFNRVLGSFGIYNVDVDDVVDEGDEE